MNYRLVPMDRSTVPDVAAIDAECFSKPWSEDMLCEELYNDNASISQPWPTTARSWATPG